MVCNRKCTTDTSACNSVLLLSRHEDGSVRFWDASSTNLQLLYKYSSAPVFVTDAASPDAEEEEWPPFKKVVLTHVSCLVKASGARRHLDVLYIN